MTHKQAWADLLIGSDITYILDEELMTNTTSTVVSCRDTDTGEVLLMLEDGTERIFATPDETDAENLLVACLKDPNKTVPESTLAKFSPESRTRAINKAASEKPTPVEPPKPK